MVVFSGNKLYAEGCLRGMGLVGQAFRKDLNHLRVKEVKGILVKIENCKMCQI